VAGRPVYCSGEEWAPEHPPPFLLFPPLPLSKKKQKQKNKKEKQTKKKGCLGDIFIKL
jgi:hypothetical protein